MRRASSRTRQPRSLPRRHWPCSLPRPARLQQPPLQPSALLLRPLRRLRQSRGLQMRRASSRTRQPRSLPRRHWPCSLPRPARLQQPPLQPSALLLRPLRRLRQSRGLQMRRASSRTRQPRCCSGPSRGSLRASSSSSSSLYHPQRRLSLRLHHSQQRRPCLHLQPVASSSRRSPWTSPQPGPAATAAALQRRQPPCWPGLRSACSAAASSRSRNSGRASSTRSLRLCLRSRLHRSSRSSSSSRGRDLASRLMPWSARPPGSQAAQAAPPPLLQRC